MSSLTNNILLRGKLAGYFTTVKGHDEAPTIVQVFGQDDKPLSPFEYTALEIAQAVQLAIPNSHAVTDERVFSTGYVWVDYPKYGL